MAIFKVQDFEGADFDRPEGVVGDPTNPDELVTLPLEDGSLAQLGTKRTLLKLLRAMRLRRQWLLHASDETLGVAVGGCKLVFFESTLLAQRLIAGFLPVYIGGEVLWAHRTLSLMLPLKDALPSLGFHDESGQRIFEQNNELREINVVAVDWSYPSTSLKDADPLRFDFTPE